MHNFLFFENSLGTIWKWFNYERFEYIVNKCKKTEQQMVQNIFNDFSLYDFLDARNFLSN
jgi:hypothetical protein